MQVKRTSGLLSASFANSNAFAALPLLQHNLACVSGHDIAAVAVIAGSKQCSMEFIVLFTAELNGDLQGNGSPKNEIYNF